jgi:hypothetical protein
MKPIVVWCVLFTLIPAYLAAQPAQLFFGGSGHDLFHEVLPAGDGNYFLLGSKNAGNNRIWLLKVQPHGEVIWERLYAASSSSAYEYGHKLTILPNGNLLIVGEQHDDEFLWVKQAIVLLADAQGNQIWKHTYNQTSAAFDAIPTSNGYMVVGWFDNIGASSTGLVWSLDANGHLLERHTITVANQNYVRRIFPTADGNFVIIGRANVIGVGYQGIFLRKITPSAELLWQETLDLGRREDAFSSMSPYFHNQPLGALQMPDGSFWVANETAAGLGVALLHYAAEGSLLERKEFGYRDVHEYPYGLSLLDDGSFLIVGGTRTGTLNEPGSFAMRVVSQGKQVWRKNYDAPMVRERLLSAAELPDGRLLMAGLSDVPGGAGGADGWLLLAEADGNVLPWKVRGRVAFDLEGGCFTSEDSPPAAGWIISVASQSGTELVVTAPDGTFVHHTDDADKVYTLHPASPAEAWSVCQNEIAMSSNAANPEAVLDFSVQSSPIQCPLLEVSIAQPDLKRCEDSHFLVTVRNRGVEASPPQLLTLSLDPALQWVSATVPVFQFGQTVEIDLPAIPGFSAQNIGLVLRLDCQAQLGRNHPVLAAIAPSPCSPAWDGPDFAATGRCEGGSATFELQNLGGGGDDAGTSYRVFANDLLAINGIDLSLPEGGVPVSLSFPADGRTWRLELSQPPGHPAGERTVALVDGCGLAPNGLQAIGYQNAFRPDDSGPERSYVSPASTVGVPSVVVPAVQGFGLYNLIGDTAPLEFTARAQNPLPQTAQEVLFQLDFSAAFDLTTFEVLASDGAAALAFTERGSIRVSLANAQIPPSGTALLRFRVAPQADLLPDIGYASLLSVDGQAFFDQHGPVVMPPGYLNYSALFPLAKDPNYDYPPEIFSFGGRSYDFGTVIETAPNGHLFLGGETLSFSNHTRYNGLLVKTNADGQAFWQEAIDLDGGRCTVKGIVPLPDGGCLIAGNSRLPGISSNDLSDYHPYIGRVDAAGRLLWWERQRPVSPASGAWVEGMVATPDGGGIVFGFSQSPGNPGWDEFYWRIDPEGQTLWLTFEHQPGLAFVPKWMVPSADGSFIFAGRNATWLSNGQLFFQKISAEGQKIWSRTHQTEDRIFARDLALTSDGGLLIAGYSRWTTPLGNFRTTPTFIKFDAEGFPLWEKNHTVGPFRTARIEAIAAAPDGGFYAAGEIFIDEEERFTDMLLLKIDNAADTLWWKNYGTRNAEVAWAIAVPDAERIFLWGFNQPRSPSWNLQALLVRADAQGELISGNELLPPPPLVAQALVLPNPARERAHVILSPPPGQAVLWMLSDLAGRRVATGRTATGLFDLELGACPPGLYVLSFPGSSFPAQRVLVSR